MEYSNICLQGQRIRPMGDDLLSDLRFNKFAVSVVVAAP